MRGPVGRAQNCGVVMKSFIRQFLFASSSLGLFLGVVVWIVGQWWYLDAAIPTPNGSVYIMANNTGPVVCKWTFRRDCFLKLDPRQASSPLDQIFNSQTYTDILYYKPDYMIDTYPLVIIREFNHGAWQGTIIATRYWVIVPFFVLSYAGQKWMHRNRRDTEKANCPNIGPSQIQ
jgi:hypothetical protein